MNPTRFARDLARIRDELRVPHLSAAIVESGHIVWHNDSATMQFPIASLTKTMTAVLVMQLVELGRLSLDRRVRQILSHTSDGTPGEEYLYNGAIFNSLTAVVEKAAGSPFPELLTEHIFKPLHMDHTVAGPQTRAAGGVISTTADLARYATALDGDRLVSAKSKAAMFTPTRSTRGNPLPYGLGWFSQTWLNERIIWHYGQDTGAGSLFLRIPSRKLTLIILSDSPAISDATRLLDGNVVRSPIALAFFKQFSNQGPGAFERDELENRALIAFFLGKREESAGIIKEALAKFPAMESSDDLTLLGLLAQLQLPETESCATAVLRQHPDLPPAWYYYGLYLLKARRYREATAAFQRITEHQPPWHHWSVDAARKELTQLQ